MSQNRNLQIDDNWKQQAQREKDSLSGKPPLPAPVAIPEPATPAPAPEPANQRQMPPASFELIIEMFAMQAMLSLGAIRDPSTGKPQKDLALSRHFIDLLAVLSDKSKGNLSKDEQSMLDATLYQLRMQYVNATKKV
jgi:hypothetical protein